MNYRETANRLKNAITGHVNVTTVNQLKAAVTGNARRSALIGTAAIALTGVAASPAMAFAPTPSSAATVSVAHSESGDKVSHVVKSKDKNTKAVTKTAGAAKAPSGKDLNPRHITMHQSSIKISASQMANAKKIIAEGQRRHLPPRAWVIALSTSMQETKLHNYGQLKHNDHDSLGLFQQRPSSGWGKPKDLVNPAYAAGKFYGALMHVHNWKSMPVTVAAQSVQVSAFPTRYAQWEKQATNLVLATYGQGPYANVPGAHK